MIYSFANSMIVNMHVQWILKVLIYVQVSNLYKVDIEEILENNLLWRRLINKFQMVKHKFDNIAQDL